MSELRSALRAIRKTPGLSLFIVAVLALGIGATTSIFSVVNGVLLKPLPIPDRDRVFALFEDKSSEGNNRYSLSPANFYDLREQAASFESLGPGIVFGSMGANVAGKDQPERLTVAVVSAAFLETLRYPILAGHAFTAEHDKPGANVAMISHGLWQRRFGTSAAAIGQSILVDGVNRTIIGVLGSQATYPENSDIWLPWEQRPDARQLRAVHFLTVVGRLKPGVDARAAAGELNTIAARLSASYPRENSNTGLVMVPIEEHLVGNFRLATLVLMTAVGLMLALACANVAGLMLARESSRRREYSIRLALGASRYQLMGPLLLQSILLALAGGVAGIAGSVWMVRGLTQLATEQMPRVTQVNIDARVLLFALCISIVTGVLFGLVPAWSMSRWSLNDSLKDSSRSTDARGSRLRGQLVVAQIAVSLVLLTGAALLARSFINIVSVRPGFDSENVLTLRVALPQAQYSEDPKVVAFFDALSDRIRRMPGVLSTGFINSVPLSGEGPTAWLAIEGRPIDPKTPPEVLYRTATGGYFKALGIPLRSGRLFDERDRMGRPGVVLVNEALARRFFPNENPVGKRVRLGPNPNGPWSEIAGVVGDTREIRPNREPQPEAFECYTQNPFSDMAVVIRTAGDPRPLAASVGAAVRDLDPGQPVFEVRTMEQVFSRSIAPERLSALLIGIFAALAVALSMMGLYAMLAHSVEQRTAEIGIRSALGAGSRDILRLIAGQSARLVLTGVILGAVLSFFAMRPLRSLLYGLGTSDVRTYAWVAGTIALVALAASYLPARRACAIDPAVALRNE